MMKKMKKGIQVEKKSVLLSNTDAILEYRAIYAVAAGNTP